jgi:hypothetical protein
VTLNDCDVTVLQCLVHETLKLGVRCVELVP